jgi:hypothetical protein
MRHRRLLVVLALAGAACNSSLTEPRQPSRSVSDSAPSGIPVAATRAPWDGQANDRRNVSITVAGDSVVLTHLVNTSCSHVYEATAGMVNGALVVTDVGRAPVGVGGCLAVLVLGGVPVRLAVRVPTRGLLAVVLRKRWEHVPANGVFEESEVLRRTVIVR